MSTETRDIRRAHARLRGLRLRTRTLYAVHGFSRTILVAAFLVAVTYVLDRLLVLPGFVRTLLFFGGVAWLGFEVAGRVLYPLRKRLTDDDLAATVEMRFPELGHRLLSAIQLHRDLDDPEFADSKPLAEATIDEALRSIERLPFGRSLRASGARRIAAAALFSVAILVLYAGANREYASVWFRRMIALQDTRWPRRTFLEVSFPQLGDLVVRGEDVEGRPSVSIPSGEDLIVHVRANGRVPDSVSITYDIQASTGDSRRRRESRYLTLVGKNRFQYTFVGINETLDFYVTGGDDQSGWPIYRVRVVPPPKVESVTLACLYPPYTGLPEAQVEGGNLEAPAGTKVALQLRTNQEVDRAFLVLGEDSSLPLEAEDPRSFTGAFVVEEDRQYTFLLHGRNGLKNLRPVRFSIRAIPDQPPSLDVSGTGGVDFDATPEAAIPIRVIATDDYGVASVRLMARVGRDANPLEVPLGPGAHLSEGDPTEVGPSGFPIAKKVLTLGLLDLKALAFPESDGPLEAGDILYYHVTAEDNHTDVDGAPLPQSKETKPFRIMIVQRSELERKLNDWQVRLKGDIQKVAEAETRVREDLAAFLEFDAGEDRLAPADAQKILDSEIAQNRVTNDMKRIAREFHQIFNTYLYNRIEDSPFTEKLIMRLQESARRFDVQESERYRLLFRETPEAEREHSDVLGKQLTMLEIGLETSDDLSPAVTRTLTAARKVEDGAERRRLLASSLEEVDGILAQIGLLLQKMQEWEDYQEVLQETKEILELQEDIKNRTLREIQKIREEGDRK